MKKQKAVEAAEQLLDQARTALAEAQTLKQKLAEAEIDAAATTETYAEWRRKSLLADVEIERLTKLAARRETELASEQAKAAKDEQDRIEAEFERGAEKTAKLIVDNLAAMTALARETVAAIAQSELQRVAAQATRAEGLQPLLSAEERARSVPALPRKDISDEVVTRWVFPETGSVINDPEQASKIVPYGDGKQGHLVSEYGGAGKRTRDHIKVELRAFRKVTYHPPLNRQSADALVRVLCVPGLRANDPPGWRLSRNFPSPRDLLDDLARFAERDAAGPAREVLEELLPCEASLAERALNKLTKVFQRRDDDEKAAANG